MNTPAMNTPAPTKTISMSTLAHAIDSAGPDTVAVFIQGTADISSQDRLQQIVAEVVAHPAKNIVLDLRKLEFLTSLAVGEFIGLHKAKRDRGGRVVIAGPNQFVSGVLSKARISALMPVFPSVDEAVAAIARGGGSPSGSQH